MPPKTSVARTAVILAVAAVLVGVFAVFFGLQTMVCIEARRWASASPFLYSVPKPQDVSASSDAKAPVFSHFGYEFEAPWQEVEPVENGAQAEDFARLAAKSGQVIVFFNPRALADVVGELRRSEPQRFERYTAVFGAGLFDSNYGFYSAVYAATPAQLSIFMPRRDALRTSALLTWKLAFGTNDSTDVYAVQSGEIRGFQFGDPARSNSVLLQLFDSHDEQFKLLFSSDPSKGGKIVQADINRVIQTLRPVAVEGPANRAGHAKK